MNYFRVFHYVRRRKYETFNPVKRISSPGISILATVLYRLHNDNEQL